MLAVIPACAYIFITTLHQLAPPRSMLQAAQRIELQRHWLQQARRCGVSEGLMSSFKSIT